MKSLVNLEVPTPTTDAHAVPRGYVTTQTGLLVPKSVLAAKGDLIGASAAGTPVRIPADATNYRPLVVNSAAASGLAYEGDQFAAMIRLGQAVFNLNAWTLVSGWGTQATSAVCEASPGGSVIFARRAGWFNIGGQLSVGNPGSPIWLGIRIYLNDGNRVLFASKYFENSPANLTCSVEIPPFPFNLGVNQWIAMEVFCGTVGGAAGTHVYGAFNTSYDTNLRMEYIRA